MSVFENDPFDIVFRAFENLYPGKKVICCWEPEFDADANGEVYGQTFFDEERGEFIVSVLATLKVNDAIEVFAHELAHVGAGLEHDHDLKWEEAFDAIFDEYNRIGEEEFCRHDVVEAIDGKSLVVQTENMIGGKS